MSAATPATTAALRAVRWRAGPGMLGRGAMGVGVVVLTACLLLGERWTVNCRQPSTRPLARRLRNRNGRFQCRHSGSSVPREAMEFRILGPLEVRGESGPVAVAGVKPRAVLA